SDPAPNQLLPQKFAAVRPRGSDGRSMGEVLGAGIKKVTGCGGYPTSSLEAALRFASQDEVWGETGVSRALMVRWARSDPRTTRAAISESCTSSGWAPAAPGGQPVGSIRLCNKSDIMAEIDPIAVVRSPAVAAKTCHPFQYCEATNKRLRM
ncbi:MAG: hypothetical protein CMF04_10025, partial [Hyphomonas sp.]|nr:hypothetical protein [Hyphomonas sp.]